MESGTLPCDPQAPQRLPDLIMPDPTMLDQTALEEITLTKTIMLRVLSLAVLALVMLAMNSKRCAAQNVSSAGGCNDTIDQPTPKSVSASAQVSGEDVAAETELLQAANRSRV